MTGRPVRRGRSVYRPSPALTMMLGAVVALSSTTAAAGAPSRRPLYGARPANVAHVGTPAADFVHALEPGTRVRDAVEVFNFADEEARFSVYAADLVSTAGGDAMTPAARDAEVIGTGTWLTVSRNDVSVAPRSSTEVPFVLAVPPGTVPDHYAAALVVEAGTTMPGRLRGATVTTRTRVALRVNVDVLGEIDLGVVVGPMDWARRDGSIRFTVPVTNDGTVTFGASGHVRVTAGGRDPAVRLPLTPNGLYPSPGETIELRAVWDDPPLFGHVTVYPVVDATVGTRQPRQFVGDGITLWLIPWRLLVIPAIAIVLLGVLLWSTRDRIRRWWHRRHEEHVLVREFRRQLRGNGGPDRHTRPPTPTRRR